MRLRRNIGGKSRGLMGRDVAIIRADEAQKVLAYIRSEGGESGSGGSVVVVLNLSSQTYTDLTIGLPAPGLWRVRFNSDWQGYHTDFDGVDVLDTEAQPGECDGLPFTGRLHIAPYGAIILSLD